MTTMNSGIGRWTKRLLGGLVVLVLAILAFALASLGAGTHAGIMPMWDGHIGGGGLGWSLMWLMGLLWMVALVAIPAAVIYWFVGGRPGEEASDGALTVLRERYARGEIDDEEYETRQATLELETR